MGAGFWTSLAAGAAQYGNAELAGAAASCAALFVGAKTALGAHEDQKAQQRVEKRLREHLGETEDIRRALTALAADQDMHELVSRERAAKLLKLLRCQESRLRQLIDDDDLRGLLRYLGNWLGEWCAQHQIEFAEFESRFDRFARENLAALRRIEDGVNSLQARLSPPAVHPLHQLRPPVGDFTGRQAEIDELLEKLQSGGVTITGMHGLGGIGKTELALKLAARLDGQYPDAQIYLDLRGTEGTPASAADALRHVILSFEPAQKLPEDVAQLQRLYRSVLHEKRVLLLMDNAAGGDQLLSLIPPPPGCVLLVTSRQHFALPGLYTKDLDTLSPADARNLLLRICPRIADAAERIAELCGRLPLAVRVAGSALAERRDLSPDDYVRRLADEQQRLKHLDKVAASLGLSDALLSDALRRTWYALSVFPGTFDRPAAAAVCGLEAERAQDALGDLLRFSLVEWSDATQRYRLHDLVRIYDGQHLADVERTTAQQRHAAHYRGVAAAADQLYLSGAEGVMKGLALFDLEWPNIAAGFAWVQANATANDEAAHLCSEYPGVGVYCRFLRQHPRENITWLDVALAAARRIHDKRAEGVHLGNLGNAYTRLGEPHRAIEFYEQQLTIAHEIGNRRGEGVALGNLGNGYLALGQPGRAIEFYEQQLPITREIGDRRGEGNALGSLGSVYLVSGEPRRAIEFYERQLPITREIGDRHGESHALGNLGNANYASGELRQAIKSYKLALAISREIGDRGGEGNSLGNLGNAYAGLGEPRQAIEFYEQRLTIAREIGDRRGEANACWNMGDEYAKLCDLARAVELMQLCVDYDREIGHPDAEKRAARVAELRKRLDP